MSHVTKQKSRLMTSEMAALERACRERGVRLVRGAGKFAWWSGEDGCDHRIEDADAVEGSFHVGLKQEEDGSLTAMYDTYGHRGEWIPRKLGEGLTGLREQYTAEVAREELESMGFVVDSMERDEETGELVLQAEMA